MSSIEQRLTDNLSKLRIAPSKELVSIFYLNFRNILEAVSATLSNEDLDNSSLKLDLKQLRQLKNSIAIGQLIGALIIRLLYIYLPVQHISAEREKIQIRNNIFTLLQALSSEIINPVFGQVYQGNNAQAKIIQYIQIVNKEFIQNENQDSENVGKDIVKIYFNGTMGTNTYTCDIPVKFLDKIASDFEITVSSLGSKTSRVELFGMYDELCSHLNTCVQNQSKEVFRSIYLMYGAMLYYETFRRKHQLLQKTNEIHVYLTRFTITISPKVNQSEDRQIHVLRVGLCFEQKDVTKISHQQFYKEQKELADSLKQVHHFKMSLFLSKYAHCFEPQTQLGQGSFGTIFPSQSLQLSGQKQLSDGSFCVSFLKKSIAIKRFKESTHVYNQKGYRIQKSREEMILSCIKEVKYKQTFKKARNVLGMPTERFLVGIDNLATLLETFKMADQAQQREYSNVNHTTYLVFNRSECTLGDTALRTILKSQANFEQLQYSISKQIFEGLYCLHLDLHHLHPEVLEKYFLQQGKQEENQNNAHLDKLQRCGILHRDIKSANILIDTKKQSKDQISSIKLQLIDFGMSSIMNFQAYPTRTTCGSPHFMAPQMKVSEKYDQKVDIWSAGVVIQEQLLQSKVFVASQQKQKIKQEAVDKQVLRLKDDFHSKWQHVVSSCLAVDVRLRKNAKELLQMLDKYKCMLIGRSQQNSFKDGSMKIFYFKSNVLNHQQDEVNIQPLKNYDLLQETALNQRFLLSHYINNPIISLKQKIPVLLCFLKTLLDIKSTDKLIPLFLQTEVMTYEINIQHKQQLYILLKFNEENIAQSPFKLKTTTIKKPEATVVKSQLSQSLWFHEQIVCSGQQIKRVGTLLIFDDKKYVFDIKNQNKYLYSGYTITEELSSEASSKFHKLIFEPHQQSYVEANLQSSILTSLSLDNLNQKRSFEVYFYHNSKTKLNQFLDFMNMLLHKQIEIQIFPDRRGKNSSIATTNKSLFLLGYVKFRKVNQNKSSQDAIYINLLESELDLLFKVLIEKQPKIFFDDKQTLKRLLLLLLNKKCKLCYSFFYKLSLLYQCNSKQSFFELYNVLRPFMEGEYFISHYNFLLIKIVSLYSKHPSKSAKANMTLDMIITELTLLFEKSNVQFNNKFKSKIMHGKIQNENSSYKTVTPHKLLSIIRKNIIGKLSELQNLNKLMNDYKYFLLSIFIMRWIFSAQDPSQCPFNNNWFLSKKNCRAIGQESTIKAIK